MDGHWGWNQDLLVHGSTFNHRATLAGEHSFYCSNENITFLLLFSVKIRQTQENTNPCPLHLPANLKCRNFVKCRLLQLVLPRLAANTECSVIMPKGALEHCQYLSVYLQMSEGKKEIIKSVASVKFLLKNFPQLAENILFP